MSQDQISAVLSDAVKGVANDSNSYENMSVESLALLVNTERLKHIEDKITGEFVELKKRQDQVSFLRKLVKTVNTATVDEQLDCSKNGELMALLQKAKEYGVEMKDGKVKFNKEERERLIENIRMTADDFNVLNDMQLQTITRLTSERYESYQIAKSIMKPIHDDKVNKMRSMAR